MEDSAYRAIAIVGAGAIMPDAPNVAAFWNNVKTGRNCISEVPADRWDPALYYDADHGAPDKTYSKIGGWVREFVWDPMKWRLPLPPRVVNGMDDAQKWAIACAREALEDYGYPNRPLDGDRTAVILGNALGGEKHYLTCLRLYFPEYARELSESASFAALPETMRSDITRELHSRIGKYLPEVTEDSMPGELSNCLAGRIANIYNLRGPNFTTDAACASAMAALTSAAHGLVANDFDVALAGGIDRNMGAPSFVKFCKIGALSATGTRPYAEGADGFVMGEGAAIFVLKRLADAERDGDKIYAVLRGIAGSSDGKGKGITAPNPVGQRLAVERAWQNAGVAPTAATLIEGHGTSTKVGDVVETQSMAEVLGRFNLPVGSVALGSVKSNIGHLKGAAGAAGLLKVVLALRDKVLPPSANCPRPNPDIDFAHSPLYVNTELKPWQVADGAVRSAGLSAFGFGGTNFHAVLEEYIPHRITGGNGKRSVAVSGPARLTTQQSGAMNASSECKVPLRGALLIGAASATALAERLRAVQKSAEAGNAPPLAAPAESDLRAPERLAIDYADATDLADKSAKALKALAANQPPIWKALRAQGIFRGQGPAPKVAFLYTGQGSQYGNMLKALRDVEPIVAETFAEADGVLTPILGKPLSEFIFVDENDAEAVARAEEDIRQTAITQPAVIASDIALTRLAAAYGIQPDMAMGHSVGEYGALVAAGALPFTDAMEAVSARGREMTRVSFEDNGKMAAVFAPLDEIDRILKTIDGYVVTANINSNGQAVIGGTSKAVDQAVETFLKAGYNAVPLPVSHAFHTKIVAPASVPFGKMLARLRMQPPQLPIISNIDGEFYPMGPGVVPKMLDMLATQIASPVQFVKGLETLYAAGARIFVEMGPKKALQGFADDVLGGRGDVVSLFTNHPKVGDIPSFNQALCGLYAAGLGRGQAEASRETSVVSVQGRSDNPAWLPVTITGAALGLPGTERVFDDSNVRRILHGEPFIDVLPNRLRKAQLDKNVTRLMKNDNGGPTFELITKTTDVIRLAARAGTFEIDKEFGVASDRLDSMDQTTRLAMAVGLDALRDAGIPLVLHYKTTTRGTQIPDRWLLPESMRDDTGVIFGSAYPGFNAFGEETKLFYDDQARRQQLETLQALLEQAAGANGLRDEISRRIEELRAAIAANPYTFNRRFVMKALSMGHSQLAEFIGARGPNTQINCACASTSQALSLAEDWIRAGRCKRVVVVSADDVTSDHLMGWLGTGFLASGAAATGEVLEETALPFDRRRNGLLLGMGAAGMVVESAESARERGMRPICEVLGTLTANSAFHATRLDVTHIGGLMEKLISQVEKTAGISRRQIAPETVFVSHETYTPARGGSASAEINALRRVFGEDADRIVIANTKGFTGHAMGTGIEEVVAVKALETGCVPPVANFKEVDPELGALNLSKGGSYPVQYALRLAAGFGSQISMALLRWVKPPNGARSHVNALGYANRVADANVWKAWLAQAAGQPAPELEVVQRTLRVKDIKTAARLAANQDAQPVAVAAPVKAVAAAAAVGSAYVATPAVPLPVSQAKVAVAPPPPPPPKAVAEVDPVKERLLALVVEKTGYPIDMLDLDLDMEADLGVDTVKQAELFAAIREVYNIERDANLKLRDFPTLKHVIGFVYSKRPDLAEAKAKAAQQVVAQPKMMTAAPVASAPVPAAAPVVAVEAVVDDPVQEAILTLVVEKTGYPKDMLDLDLDLEADLGVDTVKQAELMAAIRGIYNIPRDENLKLRDFPTLKHVIGFVYSKRPDLAAAKTKSAQKAAVQELTKVVAPAPVTAPVAVEAIADDPVKEAILTLVVEKTGYPKDMLDLELDLEADLGVDTVKQAELMAAIRGIYNIQRDENLKLRDFPTLKHVIGFVYSKRPDLAAAKTKSAQKAAVQELTKVVAPAPVTAPVAVEAIADDPVQEAILTLVVEKTGYPKDMLDLDLDLEADLGVDTVKQAELMAAIRGLYNIPRDENLKLRDFPTLAHVIKFAHDKLAAQGGAPVAGTSAIEEKPESKAVAPVASMLASLDAANSIPRRVPVPTLRPALSVCKPTGVTLGPGSRIVLMADKGGAADALAQTLQAFKVEVLRIEDTAEADALTKQVNAWLAAGPVQGVYWLPALDDEGSLSQMDLTGWSEALRVRVKALYIVMRLLYEQVAAPDTFLISAVRLGGQHGYDAAGAVAPLGGAVAGFTKTYKRERPDVLVKVVDFEASRDASQVAEVLIDETMRDPGAVEIGYKEGLRWTVGLQEQPAIDGQPGMKLNKDSVFVITGAAGGIVSAITADLAAASGGTFYLLDLVPEPDPANSDLKRFVNDKDGLKRDLFARIQARGERATPALVEKELAALERAQAAWKAIDAVRSAGGTAHYFSVNLTDANGVANVINQVRERSGRIDVLLHAAGMERSHFLPDKDPREFDLVFDVKSHGWFNLLHAIGDMPLGATVAFSSIAGRFGNGGQADYSSANDLLCKITSGFRTTRPTTRGIAIDWTAWGGIGMATRGSIPKMMELAGIDMLPPEAGVPLIRRELISGGTCGEIVVAQRLGILLNEFDAAGGIDTATAEASGEKRSPEQGPMIGKIAGMGLYSGLTIETTLEPKIQPYLHDHKIDGTAVLPGVMGIEGFAEAASSMLPGWHVESIENINFLAPFKFYKNKPRTLTVKAVFYPQGDTVLVDCQLIGSRQLPKQAEPEVTTHFTARVRMTRRALEGSTTKALSGPVGAVVEAADIYRVYFHGPAYRVLEGAWREDDRIVGQMAGNLPVHHQPSEQPILVAPRLIELCFQTAGLWEMGMQGRMGLPQYVHEIRFFERADLIESQLHAVVTAASNGSFDADIVDPAGKRYLHLGGYRTIALPYTVDSEPFKALQPMEVTSIAS
jgi:acyl transferase domain-containing protein/NAD(P)-dependent dehydrogenase (short-subunit alcohol dehydrogenase family)